MNLFYFCSVTLQWLKSQFHRELHLPWITDTLPQEPVKVKEPGRHERVDVVCVIERIEHLNCGNQGVSLAKLEPSGQPPIKREKLVVLAERIAICSGPRRRGRRLCGTTLKARNEFEPPRQLSEHVEVEFVPDIAI